MKAFGILAAAGLLSSAVAQPHVRRGGHAALHRRADQADSETCNCTSTVTVYSCTAPAATPTTTIESTSYLTKTVVVTSTNGVPAPSEPAVVGSSSTGVDVLTLTNTRSTYVCPESSAPGQPGTEVQPTTAAQPSQPPQPSQPAQQPSQPAQPDNSSQPPAQSGPEPTTTIHQTQTVDITSTVTATASPSTPAASTGVPSTTAAPVPPPQSQPPAPTHHITTFTTPGTYTIPDKTITLTSTAIVCDATSTPVGPGEHTFGGVTTVVSTHTTVTCPVATTSTVGNDITSFITHTTYVCPSAGTYTIGTFTTSMTESSTIVYPTPATYTPGTYHQPSTVVTVTESSTIYVCPATPTPILASTTPVAASTTPAATSAATTVASTSVASSTPSSTPSSGNGKRAYGMTFSPYTNDGQCMQAEDVETNIAKIAAKGIPAVRVYGTDCNGLENIGNSAKKHGLKMIVGVFIDNKGIAGAKDFIQQIVEWGHWELVQLIVVGNEAIQNGYCTAEELAGFITTAAGAFKKGGYNGPVTTTEPIDVWEKNGAALCPAVDVLGANLHPFFNAQTKAGDAGKFVKSQFEVLKKTCNGKKVLNLETGWPSAGNANGEAVPGTSQQAEAISSLIEEVGSESVFFSYTDDAWKSAGEFDVEQHWGCFSQF
ncbi:beta-glucosidase 5 [Ascosphaera apis ARSEF 7405]|uniref:Probable beta-glucosidase btgE n=1 Tax=Ascosphaera apis ARSEF 7405 TaxID=392613 RepID=A0A168AH25_9EURO|nr:beta-glucosidase 5 [Ascosphaera apis ARSEF 7405]